MRTRGLRNLARRTGWLALPLLLLGAGCAATAPSVTRAGTGPAAGNAIVVGKFGVPPAAAGGAVTRHMKIVSLDDKKEWSIPFREGASKDDGHSAPFLIELPAGKYHITTWEVTFTNQDLRQFQLSQEDAGVIFDAPVGRVTCIGALYPLRRSRAFQKIAGQLESMLVDLLPKDECAPLTEFVRAEAPNLPAPVDAKLAVNLRCPRCQADKR
jgi:hypothetical protein